MDDNEYKLMLLGIAKDIINLKIDNQVILNVLIDNNIITLDDLHKYREKIGPHYLKKLHMIEKLMENIYEDDHFEDILKRKLNGETISEEEIKDAMNYLDNLKDA